MRTFETLVAKSRQSLQFIDSSIIRVHQRAAGGKKRARSRHWPVSWRIEHQVSCCRRRTWLAGAADAEARAGLGTRGGTGVDQDLPLAEAFVGDRGYDWKYPVDLVNSKGGDAEIRTQRHVKKQRPSSLSCWRRPPVAKGL